MLDLDPSAFHTVFVDLIPTAALVCAAWVGMLMKNALYRMELRQAEVKEELIRTQTEMQRDLTAKHAENKQALAVHSARDEQQLEALDTRLDRIERKLDHATNGHA